MEKNTPILDKKTYICLVDRTGNNLFIRIIVNLGSGLMKLLKQISAGQVGLKGPKKKTVYSAEVIGRAMGAYLLVNNIKEIDLYIRSKSKKFYFFKYAVKAMCNSSGVVVKKLKFFMVKAHNGTRLRKAKRR